MFDAYTARKAAPRIILAVIGINLSIYLCLGAIDITNILGRGMNDLLTKPFIDANNYDYGITGLATNAQGAGAGYGILVSGGGLGALVGAGLTFAAAPLATLGLLIILILPIAFTALAIMITIVIRQALLIFLTVISPVAIACFVLPGTEKYFKQWLDLFTKTLMVYPIIAIIFAMSDIFGSIIFNSAQSGSSLTGFVKIITGIIVIYAPLVLIPFAFRFAGGAMGKLAGVATAGASKVSNMGPVKGRREIAKRDLANQMTQNRATTAGRFQSYASKNTTGRVGRFAANRMASGIGGYNIEAQASTLRGQAAKVVNDQIATGVDDEVRALTVNKNTSESQVKADGTKQYKTLGGAWVDESHVDAAYSRWGKDQYVQQAALSYEMRKAAEVGEVQGVTDNYMDVAKGWGMNLNEANGAFKGAGFENANTHLEYKHTSFDADGNAKISDGFVKEAYEKKGSYALSNMSSQTARQLRMQYAAAEASGDTVQQQKIRAIAETFVQRGGMGQQVGEVDGRPVVQAAPAGVAPAAAPSAQSDAGGTLVDGTSTAESRAARAGTTAGPDIAPGYFAASGPAAVNQELYALVTETGVLDSPQTQRAPTLHSGERLDNDNRGESIPGARQR